MNKQLFLAMILISSFFSYNIFAVKEDAKMEEMSNKEIVEEVVKIAQETKDGVTFTMSHDEAAALYGIPTAEEIRKEL